MKKESENLGEILAGDRIENSDYELLFGKEEVCKILCRVDVTRKQAKKFAKYIEQEYTAHWCGRGQWCFPQRTLVFSSLPGVPSHALSLHHSCAGYARHLY